MSNQKQNGYEVDQFRGVFSLLLTPFQKNGEIDWSTYDRYVNWQISSQPNGLFAVCGSSEMKWLSLQERLDLAKRTVEQAGQLPVVATANLEPQLEDQVVELQRMIETGVSAVVLIPPDGLGKSPSKLKEHLAHLADAATCPVFLYEWPQVDHHFIHSSMYADLVSKHSIYGIKDTTCTMEGIQAKIDAAPSSIVYQANTPYMLDAIEMGAKGIMAVTSAAASALVVKFWEKTQEKHADAERLHRQLVYLDSVLRSGYPSTAKYLTSLQGIPMETTTRWPVELNPEIAKAISVCYQELQQDLS